MAQYKRYTWIGNKIPESDMAELYKLSKSRKKPITILVKEAIQDYLAKN